MSGIARKFAVSAGGVVADQTVHIFLHGKIKTAVFPPVTRMACHTVLLVGNWGGTVVVDDVFLAAHPSGLGIERLPCPVLGMLHLLGCFCMANQASLRNLRSGPEIAIQFLELAVIGRGCLYWFDNGRCHSLSGKRV